MLVLGGWGLVDFALLGQRWTSYEHYHLPDCLFEAKQSTVDGGGDDRLKLWDCDSLHDFTILNQYYLVLPEPHFCQNFHQLLNWTTVSPDATMRLFTPATKTTTIRAITTKRFLTHHVLLATRFSTTTTRITTHHGSHIRPYSSEKGTPPSPLSSQSQPQSTFNPEIYLQTATTTLSLIPPKLIPDTLHPTQSHLLSLALSSHLPSICLSQGFNAQPPSPNKSIFPWPDQENNQLPPGYHLIYYPLQTPPHLLFPDGTDADHCPGGPFTRRMWAGGRIDFGKGESEEQQQQQQQQQQFKVDGRKTVCVETLGTPVLQVGNSGKEQDQKVYVDVWRRYISFPPEATSKEVERVVADVINSSSTTPTTHNKERKEEGVISELRRLVFLRERPDDDDERSEPFPSPIPNPNPTNHPQQKLEPVPAPAPAPAPARIIRVPHQPDFSFKMTPDATLLFQFSALTFNAHAIHLDPLYAREVEGYKERLVHGPLTLVIMLRGVEGFLKRAAAAAAAAGVGTGTGTGVDTTTTAAAAANSSVGTSGVSEVIKERLFVPPGEETADGKRKKRWEIASIEYKNLRPLFVGEEMKVCVRLLPNREKKSSDGGGGGDKAGLGLSLGARSERVDVWIEAPDGGMAVKGTVGIQWR
ncbi:hypothetical protein NEUTE1DRAFT_129488 [Neurospora tetrasperma FGSC 2508]|uniref:MaoC-like domain-containing protein n=1 Tax=Neurospora tetrasperma (strain FGSC 2508 / ATCC MYA-4615 / P0657) TaxID=510951 RepID=F8MLG0_NEUT8|nr:uncharacterized protein NEUTE1DRAFT_129488 [Neurospora tetrasperma FGSC 2508]EGO57582.1 hypothetical protein NEUTE1DRAFT_129488 [Neurospora tetrasperma FGSC 2508]EGZ72153.1 hypothetical protein NEUTE2DRAFT_150643 [Neurospora tetrasperma FGSC 2509]